MTVCNPHIKVGSMIRDPSLWFYRLYLFTAFHYTIKYLIFNGMNLNFVGQLFIQLHHHVGNPDLPSTKEGPLNTDPRVLLNPLFHGLIRYIDQNQKKKTQ